VFIGASRFTSGTAVNATEGSVLRLDSRGSCSLAAKRAQPLVNDDEQLEDGTILYFGEGQEGDMTFDHGNLAVRDHAENGKDLFLFRKVRQGYVRFVGQFVCGGYEIRPDVRDRNGNPRNAIVFQLIPHDQLAAVESGGGDTSAGELDSHDLSELRRAALEGAAQGASRADARATVWRRSNAVRRYVLVRADGRCEGCGIAAPFVRVDGSPYLEPHHTRRLTDSGPDHPAHVIALCPTCHSRVHYGIEGRSYNKALVEKLSTIEAQLASNSVI
jgi:5-methylcytosine-specific restriction protein A